MMIMNDDWMMNMMINGCNDDDQWWMMNKWMIMNK